MISWRCQACANAINRRVPGKAYTTYGEKPSRQLCASIRAAFRLATTGNKTSHLPGIQYAGSHGLPGICVGCPRGIQQKAWQLCCRPFAVCKGSATPMALAVAAGSVQCRLPERAITVSSPGMDQAYPAQTAPDRSTCLPGDPQLVCLPMERLRILHRAKSQQK